MQNIVAHTITVFMGFFAIMNPIANVPIFIGLTEEDDRRTKHLVAIRSVVLAFFIVVVFSIAGNVIFGLFSITLQAFRITGGAVVFVIGYHMLQGSHSTVHQLNSEDSEKVKEAQLSVAISPLAMPILAGPGTIATAMNFSSQGGITAILITIISFAVLCLITYLFFLFGEKFVTYIGAGAISVITRMMGLILAAIGVQMVIAGIKGAFSLP